jgi:hypothetical protein
MTTSRVVRRRGKGWLKAVTPLILITTLVDAIDEIATS